MTPGSPGVAVGCGGPELLGQTRSLIHRAHLLGLSEDLPERIDIVDRAEQIARVLPALEEMLDGGLMVIQDVKVLHYRHHESPDRETP